MDDEMETFARDTANQALDETETWKCAARQIKKAFDEKCGPTWQCVVGKKFASYVTHARYSFSYFKLAPDAHIEIFKSD